MPEMPLLIFPEKGSFDLFYEIHPMKNQNKEHNVFKIISQELEDQNISFSELINQKQDLYEKV